MPRRGRPPSVTARFAVLVHAIGAARALSDAGALASEEGPRYVIHLSKTRPDVSPLASARSVRVTASDGKRYACVVPSRGEEDADLDADSGRVSDGAEASTGGTSVDEHLTALEGRCFYYSNGDWWTYELCYKDRVSQFHREGTTRVSSYSLGRFDAEATARLERELAARETAGDARGIGDALLVDDRRYHAHAFTGGNKCEDVGAAYEDVSRESEVRFVCAEDGGEGLSAVEEPVTCKYVLTFRTPLACNAKELRPKSPEVEHVTCSLAEDDDATFAGDASHGVELTPHDEL